MVNNIHLIGYASGLGGVDRGTGEGPRVIQESSDLMRLKQQGLHFTWEAMITPPTQSLSVVASIQYMCEKLANIISHLVAEKKFFSVIGGDHSCAIGTWSGAYDALHKKGNLGLIWIDAHMDSHTFETSETGRVHGMPVASLLGHGAPPLISILHAQAKIKPENICMIGIRSFERGEADLLKKLGVRIYFMAEVKERGFNTVFKEALEHVKANTIHYGLSIDLDSINPDEVPGTDVPELNGIHALDIASALSTLSSDNQLIGIEIVEFNPSRDKQQKTEKLVVSFLEKLMKGK